MFTSTATLGTERSAIVMVAMPDRRFQERVEIASAGPLQEAPPKPAGLLPAGVPTVDDDAPRRLPLNDTPWLVP